MQVTPSGTYPQAARTSTETATRATGSSPSTPTANPADTGDFQPTGDLAKLLTAIRQTPDVRSDAVQSASARVASGELSTPEAATETARAILDSNKTTGE